MHSELDHSYQVTLSQSGEVFVQNNLESPLPLKHGKSCSFSLLLQIITKLLSQIITQNFLTIL